MSMHLCGPGLTTTSYKKRTNKITKAKQEEFERGWRDRNQRLKEMHLPKETFEQYMEFVYGRCKKEKRQTSSNTKFSAAATKATESNTLNKHNTTNNSILNSQIGREVDSSKYRSLDTWVTGPCSSKPAPTYTGTKVIGVAVLHKSCLQPVFSQEEAEDVARMRR